VSSELDSPINLEENSKEYTEVKLTQSAYEYIEHKINEDEDGNARSPLIIKHVKENIYKIRAQNYVGSLKIPNSHQIIIHPKVKLNFIQMLGHTLKIEDQDFFDPTNITAGDSIVDLLAKLFINNASELIDEGIYRNYILETEEISTIRGKLLLAQNIRSPRITKEKFWCEFDQISANVLENQIILFCAKILSEHVKQNSKIKIDLQDIIFKLQKEGVEDVSIETYQIDQVSFQKMNLHYADIISLCDFILQLIWYDEFSSDGEQSAYGLLIYMPGLFEKFIFKICCELYSKDFDVDAHPPNYDLVKKSNLNYSQYNAEAISTPDSLEPDIVFSNIQNKKPEFVLEIKYKKDKPDASDYYQSLAYLLALKCPVMLFLPIFTSKKMGDFKVKPLLDHPDKIFVRTINFSPEDEDGNVVKDYIETMKMRIRRELKETFPDIIS